MLPQGQVFVGATAAQLQSQTAADRFTRCPRRTFLKPPRCHPPAARPWPGSSPQAGRRESARLAPASGIFSLSGVDGTQSALSPAGPSTGAVETLWWIMAAGAALIWLVVVALALWSLRPNPEGRARFGGMALVVGAGVVFPIIALTALLVYTLGVGRNLRAAPVSGEGPLRIEAFGKQWWWEVRHLREGLSPIVSANEIHIPTGHPVEIAVRTEDVIHGFWVPSLAGKIDMIPGHVNRIRFMAREPGVYRGQCAEFCGAQHALMAFYVVVHEPAAFAAWFENESLPARDPEVPFLQRGQDVFLSSGCGACHTIRGTRAAGRIGPDLTHVGGRLTIAAGTLDNHAGTLAGWIAANQRIKPENRMPAFNVLDGAALRAVAAYLESPKQRPPIRPRTRRAARSRGWMRARAPSTNPGPNVRRR